MARAIEDTVRERGLTLLMGSSADDPERERALTDKFLARRVSILIIVRPSAPTTPTSSPTVRRDCQ